MTVTILNIIPRKTKHNNPLVINFIAILAKVAKSANGTIDSYEYRKGCFSLEVDRKETSDVIKKFVSLMMLIKDQLFAPTI